MGYSTDFKGEFAINRPVVGEDLEVLSKYMDFDDGRLMDGTPDSYCQWELQEDGQTIKWDGNEKFYDYIEWIKFLVNTVLEPRGYFVIGKVDWVGEDSFEDRGTISINNNACHVTKYNIKTIECPHCGELFPVKNN